MRMRNCQLSDFQKNRKQTGLYAENFMRVPWKPLNVTLSLISEQLLQSPEYTSIRTWVVRREMITRECVVVPGYSLTEH